MGQLVDGTWHAGWYDTKSTGGAFERSETKFRNWITPDGSPGPSGEGGFAPEAGRYHLYVAYACPWAHRALIFRALKGLEDMIGVSVVHPHMLEDGWTFDEDWPGATGDRLYNLPFLRDVYIRADPNVSGRVTVPVLWDRQRETIVSNESAEIIRMLNSAFDGLTGNSDDYWPEDLREPIAPVNDRIYDTVNNGVYKAGFATTQAAYDKAVGPLFDSLDWIEDRLKDGPWLMGERLTEADWRLFTTLYRFDTVYAVHFKCDRRRIVDYPHLWDYTRALYQRPGVAATCHMDHIAEHYYYSHDTVNPHRIVPVRPDIDWDAPTRR